MIIIIIIANFNWNLNPYFHLLDSLNWKKANALFNYYLGAIKIYYFITNRIFLYSLVMYFNFYSSEIFVFPYFHLNLIRRTLFSSNLTKFSFFSIKGLIFFLILMEILNNYSVV